MAFSFGFDSQKQKTSSTSTTSIDDRLRGLQEQNYATAQGLPQSYGLLSGDTINRYMSPYTANVVDTSLSDLGRFYDRALATNKGIANRSGAFTSYDGEALRDNLTTEDFGRQAGLLASGLRERGYLSSLGVAQDENRTANAFPFMRQGVLNSTLSGITPTVTTKGTSKGRSSGWNFGFTGGGGGGGSGGGGGEMEMVMAMLGG